MNSGGLTRLGWRTVLPAEQWERNQYVVVLAVFLSFMGFNFVMPFLPLYIQELGVPDVAEAAFWSGLALCVSPLLAALLAPLWGALADRFGRKPMFARSLLSFAILTLFMSLATSVYHVVAIRVLWGLMGGFATLATALVALSCPRDRVSRAVGMVQAAQIISYAIAPGLGGLLADHFGMRRSFYVPAVLYLLALLLTQLVYKEERAAGLQRSGGAVGISIGEVIRLPNFFTIVLVLFLAQFVDKSFGSILPLYVASLAGGNPGVASLSGLIVSLGAVAAAISAGTVGRLAARRSPWRLMLFSVAGGLVVCFPIAFVGAVWQLLVLRVLLGFLAGGTVTLAYTVGGLAMPSHGRTTAFGFLSSAALLGSALSPLVGGMLAGISLPGVFILDGALYALALLPLLLAKPARTPVALSASAGPETGAGGALRQ